MAMRLFTDVLNQLRFGTLTDELTKSLHELVGKVTETGRAGELRLTIKLKPGKAGQVEVSDDITVKAPKPERGTSIMFATPEGNLQREDPRQMSIEGLRSVDTETGELRHVQ